jgi:CRP-like cAMP-binding protein
MRSTPFGLIGLSACFISVMARLWKVTTITGATIIRLEKATILRMIHDDPLFSEIFIAHLVDLTIHLKADLLDQLLNSGENRLARLLLQLADFGKNGETGPTITNVSQETLADMIGTTRSRVSFFMCCRRRRTIQKTATHFLASLDFHGTGFH